MGFRFRRRLRLLPGLSLNFSKNGLSSLSIGGPGATVNVPLARSGPSRATVGLPGSGLSYTAPLGERTRSTRERRLQQQGASKLPTTQQLVSLAMEAFVGPGNVGESLWSQHDIGLVQVLLERPDTPRDVLEACQLVLSWDRVELHIRRGRGPADSLARTKQVLAAAERVIAYGRSIGIVEPGE